MSKINKLPDNVVAQIAAGEVIESPSAVVKELIENSIDAKATAIEIFIENSGLDKIQVRDNGTGIEQEDLYLALDSFATSKINQVEDIFAISSRGFRGEALGSIRSISKVVMESKFDDIDHGYKIEGSGEVIEKPSACAIEKGTNIVVSDLFFNTPVRKQFVTNLRKVRKEILDFISDNALCYPKILWYYKLDDRLVLRLPHAQSLKERISQIYTDDFANALLPVYHSSEINGKKVSIEGYISSYDFYKSDGSYMRYFVNNRPVQLSKYNGTIKRIYGELMPPGRFPVSFLFMNIEANEVDINVHPQKKEIRFKDEATIKNFFQDAIRKVIEQQGPYHMYQLRNPNKRTFTPLDDKPDTQKLDFEIPLTINEDLQNDSQFGKSSEFSPNFSEKQGSGYGFSEHDKTPTLGYGKPQQEWESSHQNEAFPHQNSEAVSKGHIMPFPQPGSYPQMGHARLFNTFVVASGEDGLYLIDQHTAHERINYENFLDRLAKKENVSQVLVTTLALNFSPADYQILNENLTKFNKLGFDFEDLGPAGWQLRAIPFYIEKGDEVKAVSHAIKLLNDNQTLTEETFFDHLAKNLSCKASIRSGDDESVPSLDLMLKNLKKCKVPNRCPHGRPTMVFLGKKELFALFKRRI